MKKTTFLLLMVLMLVSCVEEYKLNNSMASEEKQLVIQGRIASGDMSIIYINYSQPLDTQKAPQFVSEAEVRIIGQNGFQSGLGVFDEDNGYYCIDTKTLPNDTMYALQVEVDGESYQSEYLSLQDTPEIGNVIYEEHADGISIHVQTEGSGDSSPHYMWSYEEDWETHAPVDITKVPGILCWYNHQIYQHEFSAEYNPYLYCWGHNASSQIFIYSTETMQQNKVDVELLQIPIDDIRISYIYSLLVKQCSLNDEAYHYYHTLQTYFENSQALFPVMPVEIKGNMKCTSNPDIRVQGYVLATNVKTKRIFIYESEFKQIRSEYETKYCSSESPNVADEYWKEKWTDKTLGGALIVSSNGHWMPSQNEDYMKSVLYTRNCVDCRTADGATKKRPAFWPNNHE